MSLWKAIRNLQVKYLYNLFVLFIKHPLYSYATLKATIDTFVISQKRFPNIHGGDNKANAFRHALWNILIAKQCSRFSKNMQSNLDWTKKITDLHEELNPNDILPTQMDLMNNKIGRKWFLYLQNSSEEEIEEFLIQKLENAVKINTDSLLEEIDNLVFLRD